MKENNFDRRRFSASPIINQIHADLTIPISWEALLLNRNLHQSLCLSIILAACCIDGCNHKVSNSDIPPAEGPVVEDHIPKSADNDSSQVSEQDNANMAQTDLLENDDLDFRTFQTEPFNNILNAPFSEFGTDYDHTAYNKLRFFIDYLKVLPDARIIRTDGLLNYFKYNYPEPRKGEPFSISTELIQTPWNKDTQLLLIGMQAPTPTKFQNPMSFSRLDSML